MPWWVIVIGIVVIIILWFIATANGLAKKKMSAEAAFADVDVYLTQRFDAINSMVGTIKGHVGAENDILENVINARAKGLGAQTIDEKIDADNQLTGALSKLFALSESYPDLKVDQSFTKLEDQIAKLNQELVGARRYYNAAVKIYNTAIVVIPSNIVANLMGYKPMKMYEANEEQRQNVVPDFGK